MVTSLYEHKVPFHVILVKFIWHSYKQRGNVTFQQQHEPLMPDGKMGLAEVT